ncbi:MAG: transglycosylase SLT domain-containing protein [Bacteroidota bacterium]|nr:transglycosylase SLT domain-containing protein [Bacteroidota bacterium]
MILVINKILAFLNRYKAILTSLFFFLFVFIYFILKIYVYPPLNNSISYSLNNFNSNRINIPLNLNFCGEKIPANNFEIQQNLEKEFFNNAYWKSNATVLFNKAQKWFPYIEPILKQQGVPDDFKYLAVIESHLSNIVSPAGAAGFWQLVPNSARAYNLEVNQYVDERYDVEKSTVAACKHIKDAYAEFQNWTLAAAAYNMGIGGVKSALKKQNASDYFSLLLNSETKSFVYRILAYKTLFSSPAHFGIKKNKWNYYSKIPMQHIKVDSSITNLATFAKKLNCNKAVLKFYNPWLIQDVLHNPEKKVYIFNIPKNLNADYSAYIKDLIGEDGSSILETEVRSNEALKTNDTLNLTKKIIYHVVKENEKLIDISEFYEVKESDLRKWNNIRKNKMAAVGQTLTIIYFVD